MPRNAAGVYSLPDPPRVPNTVIDSPDENITRDDIATELTNSLDRNGRGGMLAPFRIADGTLAAPGLAFLNEPGTGLWRAGAGDMRVSIQGAEVMRFTVGTINFSTANVSVTGNLGVNGTTTLSTVAINAGANIILSGTSQVILSATAPQGLGFNTDGTTGLGWRSAGCFGAFGQGNEIVRFSNGGVANGGLNIFNAVQPTLQPITPGLSVALRGTTNDASAYATLFKRLDGADVAWVRNDGVGYFSGGVVIPAGQRLYLDGGSDTFIWQDANDIVRHFTGGTECLRLSGAGGHWVAITSSFANPTIAPGGGGELDINFVVANNGFRTSSAYITRIENGMSNVPIGATGLGIEMGVQGGSGTLQVYNRTAGTYGGFAFAAINYSWSIPSVGQIMLLNSAGALKVSPSGQFNSVGGLYHEINSAANDVIMQMINYSTTVDGGFGVAIQHINNGNTVGNASRYFLQAVLYTAEKFTVMTQGGIRNFSANNVNISTQEVKAAVKPLDPAMMAQYWIAHRDVSWCEFKYQNQWHDDPNFGYLAEDIAVKFANVAPWLVDEHETGPKDYMVKRKVVYYDDLHNIGHAVLSECQRRIEQLEAKLNA